ncbi:hypothetical protein MRB53_041558 [Persea americana]|nr:hypothetical protein MRB53_041558 [Persea americana]
MALTEESNLSTNSRSHTPPPLSRNKSTPPPSRAGPGSSPQPRRTYTSFLNSTDDAWKTSPRLGNDGDDDDDKNGLQYDEDEDEFGLPSIASMRRKGKRLSNKKGKDPGGFGFGGSAFGTRSDLRQLESDGTRSASWAVDNGDVADSRTIPSYPTAKSAQGKILRPQYKEILRDPANSLHLISHPGMPANANAKEADAHAARITRINKFKRILQASSISLPELREAAWSGLPNEVRAISWQLLLGYLPTSSERRVAALERKRKEYLDGVRQAFERPNGTPRTESFASPTLSAKPRGLDETIWHQISIDVPRTNPHLELYSYEATQRSLERILYVWAIRHPASGYVQGINDLVTPFWQVFLGQYMTDDDVESGMDPGQLPKAVLDAVEADSFWCLTKLLDGIQDNYIHAQPGIQRQVAALRDLTSRIDSTLAKHMEQEGVEFIQFSFRWMNCLLMREISVKNTAEDQGFSHFHLYVCAAFLVKWSEKLLRMDFQEIMMFLQSLPTKEWTEKDIELLLSEAFIWQSLFQGSKGHVVKTKGGDPGVLNL